jgi:uncharacterized repeat protein (TIGR03987 family)
MIRTAATMMVIALVCYTIGVWGERLSGRLRPWHAAFFWLGLIADTTGTEMMRRIAGGFHLTLHGATGAIALMLMCAHAIWATVVLLRRDDRAIRDFHRISVVVWAVWLVPFIGGMVAGMHR